MATKQSSPLNERQALFCARYAVHFNGALAAEEAGYSKGRAKNTAFQLLGRPDVQAEISRATEAKIKRAEMDQDEVLAALTNIIRADVRDVMEWGTTEAEIGPDGKFIEPGSDAAGTGIATAIPFVRPFNSEDLPRSASGAVSEVTLTDKGSFKVKMADKLTAIDKMMRHLGMFEKDNKQISDGLADRIAAAQGTTIPISTRKEAEG